MQERRLTRWMKELLTERRLNPDNWRYIKHTPEVLIIIHKRTTNTRTIALDKKGA